MHGGRSEDARYDVIFCSSGGTDESYAHSLGEDIVKCLAYKGFCVVKSTVREEALEKVLQEITASRNYLEPPPDEIVDGLLGPEGSQRVLEQPSLNSDEPRAVLAVLDEYMNDLARCIGPVVPALGFELRTRTPLIIHEASTARDDFPAASEKEMLRWLQTFNLARIMCLGFLGPGNGSLMLRPYWDEECDFQVIDTEPGMWVLLRADVLEHVFGSEMYRTYVLSCFLLENYGSAGLGRRSASFPMIPAARVLEELLQGGLHTEEGQEAAKAQRSCQHLPRDLESKGLRIAVRGAAVQLPTNINFFQAWPVMSQGVDCIEAIGLRRWDHASFYDPGLDSIDRGKTACRHAAFVEGLDFFDNALFMISPAETKTMAPEQRKVLEIGHEAMYDGGFIDIKSTSKSSTGVYVGTTWSEWNLIRPDDSIEQGSYGTTSNMTAILANRISYSLGMQGPSECLDTEGSSALVATCRGCDAVDPASMPTGIRSEGEKSLCLGVSLILAPAFMLMPARAGLLSSTGRCLSFDAAADGYVCGDGYGAVLLAPMPKAKQLGDGAEDSLRGVVNSCCTVNVGAVAAMNVPSGKSDVRLLQGALDRAQMSPFDLDVLECNATGSVLGDAVEVAAIVKSLCVDNLSDDILLLSACKTSLANMRTCGGMGGLMKALASLAVGMPPPDCHLKQWNPHFEDIAEDQPVLFLSETLRLAGTVSCCGVTSKGFGGTSAHVIVSRALDGQHLPPRATESRDLPIIHWPAGGGELDDGAHPEKGYAIIGSWSAWTTAVFMKEESPGVFEHIITLGEHRLEKFLILIDGRGDHVLHPSEPAASSDSRALGPSFGAEGRDWAIDARGHDHEDLGERQRLFGAEVGKAGDQYRIRLSVAGKWRSISWVKISTGAITRLKPEPARYFISANWNDWSLDEMHETESAHGIFHYEVRLLRPGGQFLIVVNKDLSQLLHPSRFSNVALGPDPEEMTEGMKWLLNGHTGDVFKISLSVVAEGQSLSKSLDWELLYHKPLTTEESMDVHRQRYFIGGTWNNWSRMYEMCWDGDHYNFMLQVGSSGEESFHILQDGDPRRTVHPLVANASFHDNPRVQTGPHGQKLLWTIGRHTLDEGSAGHQYKVRLHVMNKVDGNIPNHIEWMRVVTPPEE